MASEIDVRAQVARVFSVVKAVKVGGHPDVYGESVKLVRALDEIPYAVVGTLVEAAQKMLFAEWWQEEDALEKQAASNA